jgi:hypothetical protein
LRLKLGDARGLGVRLGEGDLLGGARGVRGLERGSLLSDFSAAGALAAAAAEGLPLVRSKNSSGFMCVHRSILPDKRTSFTAQLMRDGHIIHLGSHFCTAEEAALAVARLRQTATLEAPPAEVVTEVDGCSST